MEKLRLVRPEKKYEKQAVKYLEEFLAAGSKIHGAGGLDQYKDDYDGWLEKLAADRVQVPNEERVPSETFFLMKRLSQESHMFQEDVECLVGMVSIRLVLNDNLWNFGGHIGYSIRPSEREKGHNKVNLYLALKVCQNYGIEVALLDCDRSNIGSAKTMRALGGKMVRQYQLGDIVVQRYAIDVDAALCKYASQYDKFVSGYPD